MVQQQQHLPNLSSGLRLGFLTLLGCSQSQVMYEPVTWLFLLWLNYYYFLWPALHLISLPHFVSLHVHIYNPILYISWGRKCIQKRLFCLNTRINIRVCSFSLPNSNAPKKISSAFKKEKNLDLLLYIQTVLEIFPSEHSFFSYMGTEGSKIR